MAGCAANRAPSLQAADFLFFIALFIVYASKNKERRIHSSCLQKGYTEVLLQGSDSSESRCVLKCYYLLTVNVFLLSDSLISILFSYICAH